MKLVESDIVVNGIKLHLYRTNTNKPPLVFAHGMTDNGVCFWPIAKQFADAYEIILYDSRNHGQSDAADSITLLDRAHDLASLIEALELQKPKLVGHSLGAVTVALFAGLYPDLPGCIVLEDPPPFELMAANDEQAEASHKMWRAQAAENKQKSVEALIELSRQENPSWPEAERQPWAQSKQQVSLNVFDEGQIDAAMANETASKISCPTLIITTDLEKGAIYPPPAAEALVAKLPNAKHVNILGAGHNIRREQPAAFLEAVRNFLEDCA